MPTSAKKATKKYVPKSLTAMKAWKALKTHAKEIAGVHMRDMFAADATRGEKFAFETLGLFFDYSKNRVTSETLKLLVELAQESGLQERIDAMFSGEKINITEGRAVLHVALRTPKSMSIVVDGQDVVPEVHAVVEGAHRQTDSQCSEHRYRWIGPGSGDGV
jgi:glucose-6-phosphate isomerase